MKTCLPTSVKVADGLSDPWKSIRRYFDSHMAPQQPDLGATFANFENYLRFINMNKYKIFGDKVAGLWPCQVTQILCSKYFYQRDASEKIVEIQFQPLIFIVDARIFRDDSVTFNVKSRGQKEKNMEGTSARGRWQSRVKLSGRRCIFGRRTVSSHCIPMIMCLEWWSR